MTLVFKVLLLFCAKRSQFFLNLVSVVIRCYHLEPYSCMVAVLRNRDICDWFNIIRMAGILAFEKVLAVIFSLRHEADPKMPSDGIR